MLTVLLALPLLAGRQPAPGDPAARGRARHAVPLRRWMNDFFGDWFCARPVWQHLHKYRAHHLVHHTKTGTRGGPGHVAARRLPDHAASLRRKMLRDLPGYTGLKLMLGLLLMDAGPTSGGRWPTTREAAAGRPPLVELHGADFLL